MIVSKIKLELDLVPSVVSGNQSVRARRLFQEIAGKPHVDSPEIQAVERMSLSQLLYFALLGEGAKV